MEIEKITHYGDDCDECGVDLTKENGFIISCKQNDLWLCKTCLKSLKGHIQDQSL